MSPGPSPSLCLLIHKTGAVCHFTADHTGLSTCAWLCAALCWACGDEPRQRLSRAVCEAGAALQGAWGGEGQM